MLFFMVKLALIFWLDYESFYQVTLTNTYTKLTLIHTCLKVREKLVCM